MHSMYRIVPFLFWNDSSQGSRATDTVRQPRLPRVVIIATAIIATLGADLRAAQRKDDPPVTIYVGPLIKNGIVETDRGIEDTIKDIKRRLGFVKKELTAADTPADAQMSLFVLGRGPGRDRGAVGAAYGGAIAVVPVEEHVIDATLRVGTYERSLQCQNGDSWSACAEDLVEDVRVWLKANRGVLKQ